MSAPNGYVIGTKRIVRHGSPHLRWNLAILGDGYRDTRSEIGKYHKDTDNFVKRLRATAPFNKFWRKINVFRVDVASTDSGAIDPRGCQDGTLGSGASPRTYFSASFCNNGIRRLLEVDDTLVKDTLRHHVHGYHAAIVIVNSPIYGGSGGDVAVFSTHKDAVEIGLHELGHQVAGLADEYSYYLDCPPPDYPGDIKYAHHKEPPEANVTIHPSHARCKWRHLISPSTPSPSTTNPDCSKCDPLQTSPLPPGTVGTFEGAHSKHCGIFRPEFNCKMRHLGQPFCKVCQAAFVRTLEPFTAARRKKRK